MKYIPKIVYVITNDNYTEITYDEYLKRAEQDESYKDKKFILLHGTLMEVSLEEYKRFYRDKRRQKYIAEQARENGAVSYDAITSDEFNGEDVIVDLSDGVDEQVERKLLTEKIREGILLLSAEEQKLLDELFTEGKTERELADFYGLSQSTIHKRKKQILAKLKIFLEN